MFKLIKLEWKKNRIHKYILNALIMTAFIGLFVFALIFFGITNDSETGQPDMSMGDAFISLSIELLSGMCYLIFASVMLSSFIVSAYRNKTMGLMFSYPIKRQKILASQMLAVWIFNTLALMLTKLLLYACVSIGARFLYTPYPFTFDMSSLNFYIQLIISSSVLVVISFISLFIGLAMKSSKATIVSSFLLVSLTQGSIGDFTLSNNLIFQAVLVIISLVFAFLSISTAETKDLA